MFLQDFMWISDHLDTKFTSNMCKKSVVTDLLRCKKRLRRAIHYLLPPHTVHTSFPELHVLRASSMSRISPPWMCEDE